MAVTKRLRYEVLRRDNHTCRYCGAYAPDVKLHVDHVMPSALGGKDDPSNLVTACSACNAGKSSVGPDAPLVADVEQDALRWAQARKRAAAIIEDAHERGNDYVAAVDDAWSRWTLDNGEQVPRPADWSSSVRNIYEHGLPLSIACDLVERAMRTPRIRDTWRYYCGCCWRRVDELLEITQSLAAADPEDV